MKALVCHGPGKITCESVPDPSLHDAYGAIVRTTLCAICGSDLHPYHVEMGRPAFCIGHEAVGEVVEIGRQVRNFRIGDRVLLCAAVSCGRCRPCRAGLVSMCESREALQAYGRSAPGLGGCQAEGIAVPLADDNLIHLPHELSDEVGLLLTDTLPTAWTAARRVRVGAADTVTVIGLGAVGLQAIMCAQAMGAGRVIGIDLVPARRQTAAELGAIVFDGLEAIAGLREVTDGRGTDVVIDANGSSATTALAVDLIGKGGRVAVVGISETDTIAFPIKTGIFKNIEFHAAICSAQNEVPTLIKELAFGRLSAADLERLFTHTMGLSQGAEAYSFFDAREDGVLKMALDPAR